MCGVLYPHPRLDLSASVFISLEEGKKGSDDGDLMFVVKSFPTDVVFFVRRLNPRRFVGTSNYPICAVLVFLKGFEEIWRKSMKSFENCPFYSLRRSTLDFF